MAGRRSSPPYSFEVYFSLKRSSEERHDYVLVSQTAPIIEHYSRQADGSWSYKIYQGLDRSVTI